MPPLITDPPHPLIRQGKTGTGYRLSTVVLKPDCIIKSGWVLLKQTATLAPPTVSDLIGQGIGILQILLVLMCCQVLRTTGLKGLRNERFIQKKKDRRNGMPTNSGYNGKSQNQNNFSMGREKITWLEWTVCRDTVKI